MGHAGTRKRGGRSRPHAGTHDTRDPLIVRSSAKAAKSTEDAPATKAKAGAKPRNALRTQEDEVVIFIVFESWQRITMKRMMIMKAEVRSLPNGIIARSSDPVGTSLRA